MRITVMRKGYPDRFMEMGAKEVIKTTPGVLRGILGDLQSAVTQEDKAAFKFAAFRGNVVMEELDKAKAEMLHPLILVADTSRKKEIDAADLGTSFTFDEERGCFVLINGGLGVLPEKIMQAKW